MKTPTKSTIKQAANNAHTAADNATTAVERYEHRRAAQFLDGVVADGLGRRKLVARGNGAKVR